MLGSFCDLLMLKFFILSTKKMLFLDDTFHEDYKLIALRTNLEAYHLAYLINKYFEVSFKRADQDLEFTYQNQHTANFVFYEYFDFQWDCQMYLVANKCFTETLIAKSENILFDHHATQTLYLLKNLKHIDYLIKVEDEMNIFDSGKILKILQDIKGIQSVSQLDLSTIKNPEYLIFN